MKTLPLLIGISVAVNVGLLAAFALKPQLAPAGMRPLLPSAASAENKSLARDRAAAEARAKAQPAKAAIANADQKALWSAIDSEDLRTLIGRLRAAGFSRSIVLAIVNARLEARMASRFHALLGDMENAPYWKPDPMNSPSSSKYWEEYSQIHREKSRILRELLGDDSMAWGGVDPATAQRRQFGSIPREKIDLVQRITDDYAEMTSQIRASTQGIMLAEDREKLALLEREKRADLAAVLTPSELEEFEMRSSPVTSRLRGALSLMNASEEEFRAIFKVQQVYNERINPMMSGFIPNQVMDDRREAQRQMYEQLKSVLPAGRYDEYVRASNSEFQQLHRIAQRDNVPIETAVRAFSIREGIAAESVRIADDASLSLDQKRDALTSLAQKARTQILSTLGPGAGEAYAQTARWISSLERGSAFSLGPDGTPVNRPPSMPRK